MAAYRYLISGAVQGVFFRASTRDYALRAGIDGSARNLADGRVEVVAACADDQALARFEAWLQHGPRQARVDAVEREAAAQMPAPGFAVR